MSEEPANKKPHRHMLQIRRKEPRAGGRDPFYNPERDFAHVGPNMILGAMYALEPDTWEPWLKDFLADHDITYESIMESGAPKMLAQALNLVIKLESPPAAMEKVGFDKLPPALQMLFYARLGQVLLSAVWAGAKDVARPDSDPPVAFQEFLDDVNEAVQGFFGQKDGHAADSHPLGNGTAGPTSPERDQYDPIHFD